MAMDTRDERAAALNLYLGFGRILPYPDVAGETAADRQQVALSYPGILAGAITIPAILEDLTTLWCQVWQPALHALQTGDDTSRSATRLETAVLGYDGEQDLNTALAKYIEAEL